MPSRSASTCVPKRTAISAALLARRQIVLVPAFLLRWPDSAHPARSRSHALPLALTQFPQNQQHREFLPACARVLPRATEPLPRRPRRGQTVRTRCLVVQKLPGRVLIARPWVKGRRDKLQCQASLNQSSDHLFKYPSPVLVTLELIETGACRS